MKKRKKQILCTILSAAILFSLSACGTTPALKSKQTALSTLSAQSETTFSSNFEDVPPDAWYAEAVNWCRGNDIMSGTSASTFSPSSTMTRAMLATVIYRLAGSPAAILPPSFTDVSQDSWYAEAAAWTSENGIISEYGNRIFGAVDPVTREQLAAILWRYDGSESVSSTGSFADEASISSYAEQAVDWATANGIVAGREGNRFDPQATATRAEVAVILYRYLNSQAGDMPSGQKIPQVFMTTDISADGLIAVYEALEASPTGSIAVKLSTGEPGSNYLRTDLIGPLVQSFDAPTIVECNTAYGGSRANTAMHYQVAEDHGYTAIANVDIMDEEGSMTLPVEGGTNLTENYVGSHFTNYDYFVVLSHFKGHSKSERCDAGTLLWGILLPQPPAYQVICLQPPA